MSPLDDLQFHHLVGQQTDAPARVPAGGSEQARAISRAWASPSKIGAIGGVARFLRLSTAVSPSSTNWRRTRVVML